MDEGVVSATPPCIEQAGFDPQYQVVWRVSSSSLRCRAGYTDRDPLRAFEELRHLDRLPHAFQRDCSAVGIGIRKDNQHPGRGRSSDNIGGSNCGGDNLGKFRQDLIRRLGAAARGDLLQLVDGYHTQRDRSGVFRLLLPPLGEALHKLRSARQVWQSDAGGFREVGHCRRLSNRRRWPGDRCPGIQGCCLRLKIPMPCLAFQARAHLGSQLLPLTISLQETSTAAKPFCENIAEPQVE